MKKRIRKIFTCLTITIFGYLLFASINVEATASNINYVTSDGFELTNDFSLNEKFYSEYASITVDPSEVISGNQSLKLQTTSPAGAFTPVLLSSERDVIDMSGPNSYKLSMKLKTYSLQAIMIDIRKDWNTNTKESMPYEFGLFIDDSGESTTISRRPGWIPLDQLLTYNEQYSVDENGVISLSFEFISQEPVIFEMKGQIGDIDNGYIIVDDFLLEKQPRMIETFKNITGNFWNDTAFWANTGNITNDENEAIEGTSLKYTFTDNSEKYNVGLGGITSSEFSTALGRDHMINFDVKGLSNANGLTLVLGGGGDYKEFNLNLLDGSFTGDFENPVVTKIDDYYHVTLSFTANATETNDFTFYGGGDLGVATGIVIDNFSFTVEDNDIHVTPKINSTYNKAVAKDLKYDVDFTILNFIELRNTNDEVIDASNYIIEDNLLTLKSSYLDTLEVSEYTHKIVTNFSEKEFSFTVVDTNPIITCELNDYEQSLLQTVSINVDSKGFDFVKMTNEDYELTASDFTLTNSVIDLKSSYLKTLALGENTFIVETTGGNGSFSINIVEGRLPIEDNSKTFDKGLSEDVSFTVNIPTDTISSIELNNTTIEHYTIENNTVTVSKTYLQTLAAGTYEFTIKTANGDFAFTIEVVVEAPVITGDNTKDFDKVDVKDITYTIDLKGLAIVSLSLGESDLQATDYSYEDNTLVIKKEFLQTLKMGEFALTLKTEGGEVLLTINVMQSGLPIENNSKIFDKGLVEDVIFTINIPTDTINSIELNNVAIDDYTLENNQLTISKTYLQTLVAGTYEFTIKAIYGDYSFTIEVAAGAPVINDDTIKDFDKADAKDISFPIDLKGLAILSITIDGNVLTATDYSYADNTLVIKKEFLQTLPTDEAVLILKTEGGEVSISINVMESGLPIEDNSKTFTKGLSEDVIFTINIPTDTINGIELNDKTIDNYTVENNTLTISKTYLQTLDAGTYEFTIKTTNGDYSFTIEVVSGAPVITGDTTKDCDKADVKDISFTIDLKGFAILSLSIDGNDLTAADYSYADNTLVIKKEFLQTLQTGDTSLTLKTDGGEVYLNVNVVNNEKQADQTDNNTYLYYVIPAAVLVITGSGIVFLKKYRK